jgi:hypothetical protein
MSTRQFIKQLRLVTPASAALLGYPAEAPTFISPVIEGNNHCPVCAIEYTPLVYQVDRETHSQHWACGCCRLLASTWPILLSGWTIRLQCLASFPLLRRAQRVSAAA